MRTACQRLGHQFTATDEGFPAGMMDFGFQVSDRFASLTTSNDGTDIDVIAGRINRNGRTANQIGVFTFSTTDGAVIVSDFHLIVY